MSDVERIKITWDKITQDCEKLAQLMAKANMQENVKGFVALARGGLSIAQILGYHFRIRRIECITALGRSDEMQKLDTEILGTPSPDLGDGSGWIVVDDLVDTGRSYRFIKTLLPKARYVALYAKPEGAEDAELTVETFAQDSWLDFPWEVDPISH